MSKLIIISGPSGVGKNTVVKKLLAQNHYLQKVITCTSREKRPAETENVDYYFLTREEFEEKQEKKELLEYETVHGNYYGTPKSEVENIKSKGKIPLMVIDPKGGVNLKNQMSDEVLLIFILPESKRQLTDRIIDRGQDMSEDEIKTRMETAETEFELAKKYDYEVINKKGEVGEAAREIDEIIKDNI